MKCFLPFTGQDPRFSRDVAAYLASRGVESILNPERGAPTEEQLAHLLRDADGALAGTERYTGQVMDSAPRLKIISRVGVGYDSVDVKAATERGVLVTIAAVPELAEGMAEHTFALILTFMKQIPYMDADLRSGNWRPYHWGGEVRDLYGLTLGLLGVGRIGGEVAKRARAFRMRVIYYDIVRREDLEQSLGMEPVTLDDLLAESDVLSIHSPLTPQTKNLINENALAKMKKSALLVNTARGAIVDETALMKALMEGRLAGACLDTFSEEPLSASHPFYSLKDRLPNLIMTPHTGYGVRTGSAMVHQAAKQVADTLEGGVPENLLNPEALARRRV